MVTSTFIWLTAQPMLIAFRYKFPILVREADLAGIANIYRVGESWVIGIELKGAHSAGEASTDLLCLSGEFGTYDSALRAATDGFNVSKHLSNTAERFVEKMVDEGFCEVSIDGSWQLRRP